MQRHTLFIADLHLQEQHQATTETLSNFLNHQAGRADALYILGDFFETWIGDDDLTPFHQHIIATLKKISTQIPVYFMRGNRDFLIGNNFAKLSGCKILRDPSVINLYGNSVLLMHGDSLCTLDKRHLFFRKIMHSKLFQSFILSLPLSVRQKIAETLRSKSKQRIQGLSSHIMDVTDEAVSQYLHKYNTTQLIHGHTHRPDIHYFSFKNDHLAERIVLGAWHEKGCALRWFDNGERELVYFD